MAGKIENIRIMIIALDITLGFRLLEYKSGGQKFQ